MEYVGAFVLDEKGERIPDLNDEAMKGRADLEAKEKKGLKKLVEVKDDVRKQSIDFSKN